MCSLSVSFGSDFEADKTDFFLLIQLSLYINQNLLITLSNKTYLLFKKKPWAGTTRTSAMHSFITLISFRLFKLSREKDDKIEKIIICQSLKRLE